MTMPQQPQPFDPGNGLLAETPAEMATALIETPAGQRLALTIRTPSTTLTVLLGAADGKSWAAVLSQAAGAMSSSGLIVAGGVVNGNGKAP